MSQTVSSESVAQDQIVAFVDRILRMKEEAKSIKDDIREIYAEAKADGFDKTILGKLVNYVEKRAVDKNAVLEAESLFDLYLDAYDGVKRRPGTRVATHTHEADDGDDAEAGEILTSESEAASIPPHSSVTTPLADESESREAVGAALPATISPGTATQSTDASQERAQTATGVGTGGDNLAPASRPSASAKTGIPDHQSQIPGEGQSQHDSGVRVASVDTHPLARLKTTDEVADDMGLPSEAHPGCRKPKICGRFSHKGLCAICRGEDREAA